MYQGLICKYDGLNQVLQWKNSETFKEYLVVKGKKDVNESRVDLEKAGKEGVKCAIVTPVKSQKGTCEKIYLKFYIPFVWLIENVQL